MRYFLDTEFDGFGGDLISVALVREDGASLYRILQFSADDTWVERNVIPILDSCPEKAGPAASLRSVGLDIAEFMAGDTDPVVITDWPADIRYFCQIIEWPGGNMIPLPGLRFEMHRVDAYPTTLPGAVQHNAWWDAMALRHLLQNAQPIGSSERQRAEGNAPGDTVKTEPHD